jgi:hypothetical protein
MAGRLPIIDTFSFDSLSASAQLHSPAGEVPFRSIARFTLDPVHDGSPLAAH